ncbi:sigma factor [Streptomyces sp. NPDC056061]|uniref:sigma factor n=1 Tax=Streptomyces sp. NPDC056061 TaxID=3345700 RepID=UPI0035DC5B6B
MSRPDITEDQIRRAQAGDTDAMMDVLTACEPTIRSIVRLVAPAASADTQEDLLQDARVALMEKLRDYSSDGGAHLTSYAYTSVRRAVAESYTKMSSSLDVEPQVALQVKRALWAAGGDVDGAWKIVSSSPDPRRRVSREAFVMIHEALMDVLPLDKPVGAPGRDSTEMTLADAIPDTAADDGFSAVHRRDAARQILADLAPRQSYALRAFYGIGMMKLADEQTSDELGLSSRKKCEALRQLRTRGVKRARVVADALGIAA